MLIIKVKNKFTMIVFMNNSKPVSMSSDTTFKKIKKICIIIISNLIFQLLVMNSIFRIKRNNNIFLEYAPNCFEVKLKLVNSMSM